jgi:hypothetical protein
MMIVRSLVEDASVSLAVARCIVDASARLALTTRRQASKQRFLAGIEVNEGHAPRAALGEQEVEKFSLAEVPRVTIQQKT